MKSSGQSRGSVSRFKLLTYEQQMIKMINYKSTGVYPFDPMEVNKKRAFRKSAENYSYSNGVLKVKNVLKKNDIRPNEGTFSICIHRILNIVLKKQKIIITN